MSGLESHLLQMRGLKRIELLGGTNSVKSHLLQMRGLKPDTRGYWRYQSLSHLLQMRGLKLILSLLLLSCEGRIFYRCVD